MATTTKRAAADKSNGDATVAEEVEVVVTEVEDAAAKAGSTLVEGLRKLVLASLGAVAMTRDEVEAFVDKLVERGQLAQKDGEKLVKEERVIKGEVGRIRDVRVGPDGYIYLLTDESNGVIARLEPVQ